MAGQACDPRSDFCGAIELESPFFGNFASISRLPVVVIILGWIVVHEFNVRRDTLAKRRDLRVQYLLDAYRKLEDNAGRINALPEVRRAFESAVADIQLLGTRDQIDTLLVFLQQFKDNANGNIDPVLKLFRDDLRKELNLETNVQPVHQFRFREQNSDNVKS